MFHVILRCLPQTSCGVLDFVFTPQTCYRPIEYSRFFTKPWPHPIKTIENSVYLVIVDFYLLLLGCGLPWKLLYVKTLKQPDKKNNFKCWKLQTNSEDTVLKILQLSWLLLTKLSVVHLAVLPCKTIGKYCNYSSQLHYDWFFTALLT